MDDLVTYVFVLVGLVLLSIYNYISYRKNKLLHDAVEKIINNDVFRALLLHEIRKMINKEINRLCRERETLIKKLLKR